MPAVTPGVGARTEMTDGRIPNDPEHLQEIAPAYGDFWSHDGEFQIGAGVSL
jgi:hypothetical protein